MIDVESFMVAQAGRDQLEALFGEVKTLADLTRAVASAASGAKPYRLFSHVAIAEDAQKNKRLAAEFGDKGQELVDAFAAKHPALFARLESSNIIGHPAVASAVARVMHRESDP